MVDAKLTLDPNEKHLTEADLERRRALVGLEKPDIARLSAIGPLITDNAEKVAASFFNYLSRIDEASELFRRRDWLDEAKRLKIEHVRAMGLGEYSATYLGQRVRLAQLYSRAGITVQTFLAAFNHLVQSIDAEILSNRERPAQEAIHDVMTFNKLAFFDITIMVEVMIAERERTIAFQQEAIRELSTPVLQVRDRLLILPIIGVLDSQRAKQLTESLLHAIRTTRAKVAVMDITGVAAVDSKVANHLMQTVAAARLMGAKVIVTGLSADVAQALVALGVDLGPLNTVGDLQGGLEEAEAQLGYKVVLNGSPVSPAYAQ